VHVLIREAAVADIPAIRDLFNALIPTTTVAWRDELATIEEMESWFAELRQLAHPIFVAELDGEVVGYTCWSTFRGGERFPGYRHTVELTIHVRADHHGRRIGQELLSTLADEAVRCNVHVLVAGIDGDNTSSIAFHRALGFTEVARMPEVGRKFDRWLDLVLMQRLVE
jgi:L-amino acid N-acyltransferase YncA